MILLDNEHKQFSYLVLFAEVCLCLVLLYVGPRVEIDTGSYIGCSIFRSAFYPLLLKTYMWILGDNFYPLLVLQLVLGFIAIHYAVHLFTQLFALNTFAKLIAYLLFLTPYVGPTLIGNTILTEPISYPFFIFALGELIKGIAYQKYRNLLTGLLWTALLILTKKQFVFLYPLIAIILIFMFVKYRNFTGKVLVLITFIGSIIATNVCEKTYHYIYNDTFADVPFTGIQLINAPLFVAKKNDATVFTDPIEQELFKRIYSKMEKNGFLMSQNTHPNFNHCISNYQKYEAIYNTICHVIVNHTLLELNIRDNFVVDSILISMSLKLIKENFMLYWKLLLNNIIDNMGGYYYFLLILATFVTSLWFAIRYGATLSVISTIILLAQFGNYALITLVEPILRRYSMFTDVFTAVLLFSMAFVVISKKGKV